MSRMSLYSISLDKILTINCQQVTVHKRLAKFTAQNFPRVRDKCILDISSLLRKAPSKRVNAT